MMTLTNLNKPTVKSQGRGRSNSLPTPVVEYLKTWLMEHMHHPYPTDQEKAEMVLKTGIDVKRLNNWFVNNRIRYWKPRMETMQLQQQQHRTIPEPAVVAGPYTRLTSPAVKELALVAPKESNPATTQHYQEEVVSRTHQELVSKSTYAPSSSFTSFKTVNNTAATSTTPVSSPAACVSITSDVSQYDEGDWSDADAASIRSKGESPLPATEAALVTPSPKLSRKRTISDLEASAPSIPSSPRTKFNSKNEVLWREACVSPSREATLPTLDEAALLFGFATSSGSQ